MSLDPSADPTPTDSTKSAEERLRERAVRQLRKQSDFRSHLLIYVLVNLFLVVIWFMSGASFFWPVFPIFGWGIGLLAHWWDAYRGDGLSEDRIQRQMERLRAQD
jgi:hypothetical protein